MEVIPTKTPLRVMMRSSASRLVLTIRRWGLMLWTVTQPALTTLWQVGSGGPQAASTPDVLGTQRRCYQTAWSLLQREREERASAVILWTVPSYTTRRPGRGLPQATSTPRVLLTRRRCYQTAWFLLRRDLAERPAPVPLRAPDCTNPPPGAGPPLAGLTTPLTFLPP